MTSIALRSSFLKRYGRHGRHFTQIQPRLLSTLTKPTPTRAVLFRHRWQPKQASLLPIYSQHLRLMSNSATATSGVSSSSTGATASAAGSRSRRRPFHKRVGRRLMFYGTIFALWTYFFDADFITYFDHIYRTEYEKNNSCFEGKTVWIVGASSGIGEYLAYEVAENNANKIIISSRRESELQRVRNACKLINPGCQIIVEPLDITRFISTSEDISNDEYLTSMITEHGDIDVLVLNSGITNKSSVINTDVNVLQRLSEVNIFSPCAMASSMIRVWYNTNYINKNIKSMKNKKLHNIVVTSSLAGKCGVPDRSTYAMTKHGINGYFESLQFEHFNDNIKVSIICPGPVQLTPGSRKSMGGKYNENISRQTENKRKSMELKRCAELYVTAINYSIPESWLANNPELLIAGYFRQYLSGLMGPLARYIAPFFTPKTKDNESK